MEGDSDAETASSEPTNLEQLQQEDGSILGLLRVLLSVSTLPHILLIVVLSSLLQLAAVNNLETTSAMGFVSLSGGYLLTGLFAGWPTVQGWIRLPEHGDDERSTPMRILGSFRICLFPLLMAVVVFATLVALIGEQGALGDFTSVLPLVLSSCFVVWAIVQGRGFGRWLSSVSASKLPRGDARESGLSAFSTVASFVSVITVTFLLVYVFELVADSSTSLVKALSENIAFFAIVTVVFALSWRRSRGARLKASSRTDFHRFSNRWLALSQFMVTWHLLTVWRHEFITPGTAVLFIEEFILMMFTVLMAIWGLTSRSFRSPLKLVSTKNALPMGLAFGYAYAGSVAMLTTVLDDIQTVMMAGHLVVALTLLWMQPRVLRQTMGQTESVEHIKRVVEEAGVAADDASINIQDSPEVSPPEVAEEDDSLVQSAQDSEEPVVDDIGNEVDWKEPDVLASEVEWDDEIELLD